LRSTSPELYDALVEAGAPAEKARKAADSLGFDNVRFTAIDERCNRIEASINQIKKWIFALGLIAALLIVAWLFGWR
jgi:hypothetical protein